MRRVLNKSLLPRWLSTVPVNVPNERLVKVKIDERELSVPETSTIMQACSLAGVDIPRFCYHERLAVAGNCRMCLVQVNGGAKLVASCAAPIGPEMRIETQSTAVKKAREGVMEFLLANHPLDCPICDQGGECDLQDQAMAFGADRSRFQINKQAKRAVEDKDFGPLVKTSMNRCIHCTRCVRFANEVAGVPQLGTTGRGNDMQIGTYIGRMIDSPLSGNVIDLCPVGALTSRPYAFIARPWELRHTDSVDVMDAVGANIKVDSRGMEVMRILPRLNEQINEEWLGDKGRFSCDALRQQRLLQPLHRIGNTVVPITWEAALQMVADRLTETAVNGISTVVGRFADVESIFVMEKLLQSIGAKNALIDDTEDTLFPSDLLRELRFGVSISDVERADAILLVGCNPKTEAAVLNARLRKTWLRNDVQIAVVGDKSDLTFDYQHLGTDLNAIRKFVPTLESAQRPLVLVGQDVLLKHPNRNATMHTLQQLKLRREGWNGFCMLPLTASVTGALMLGCRPGAIPSTSKFVYLLNADDFSPSQLPSGAFVVYQGHHGDVGAQHADLILPGAAYTEKTALYVNMEGRVQETRAAVPPPGEARNDWSIIRALAEFCQIRLPYDDQYALRQKIQEEHPALTLGKTTPGTIPTCEISGATPNAVPYENSIKDYYLTDCISRNSPTMAQCSLAFTPPVTEHLMNL
ncbi:NADH-quinone oxidoreductase [Paramicrosporidium saccamoebae]|uniref:NADH-ubiquinone oxidoreductase 78 kDa subunit, mitochondrial n=1 Tax=Paramicrosporidium saccamoebae TaxID=1246581 RepID=A0A2H9TMA1_9FUNG|nr:NADH-quinone oxidoreductase [Paramicrosporidium saccamoebae]